MSQFPLKCQYIVVHGVLGGDRAWAVMSVCHTHHSVVSAVCARAEVFVASSCRLYIDVVHVATVRHGVVYVQCTWHCRYVATPPPNVARRCGRALEGLHSDFDPR